MKMARASQADLNAAMKVTGMLDDLARGHMPYVEEEHHLDLEFFDRDDPEQCRRALGVILDAASKGSMFRVTFGMVVVCDPRNKVIDPDVDVLEVHPEHQRNAEDAERFRWLTEDHADPTVRAKCRDILASMAVKSYSAACADIDAASAAPQVAGGAS